MTKRNRVSSRQYTEEFKHEAVRLSESVGVAQAAKRLDIPESSLGNWRKRKAAGKLTEPQAGASPTKRGPTELEAENSRLRRELAMAKLDVEILKKATAYFAKDSR
jgi:transposase